MSNPKISVIIPVYNAAQYLEKCLDSVLAQTFTDFELLLIDDGSKDSSGEICDRYAESDSRIRVFHKPNGGVSSARNLGLDNAKGEWIAFCDSDDYVTDKYLGDLYNEAKTTDADLVVQDYYIADKNGNIVKNNYYPAPPTFETYNESKYYEMLCEQYLYVRSGPVSKLFNSKLVADKIRFKLNIKYGEDTCFFFSYLIRCQNVCCTSRKNYIYVNRPNSAVHSKSGFDDEYKGFLANREAIMAFVYKYNLLCPQLSIYPYWCTHFLHRAITAIKRKSELLNIKEEEWNFFFLYFQPVSRKTAIDLWMLRHFHKVPFVILPYLRVMVGIRSTIESAGLNRLLDFLKR